MDSGGFVIRLVLCSKSLTTPHHNAIEPRPLSSVKLNINNKKALEFNADLVTEPERRTSDSNGRILERADGLVGGERLFADGFRPPRESAPEWKQKNGTDPEIIIYGRFNLTFSLGFVGVVVCGCLHFSSEHKPRETNHLSFSGLTFCRGHFHEQNMVLEKQSF